MNFKTLIVTTSICLAYNSLISQVVLNIKERSKPIQTFNFRNISEEDGHIYNLGLDDKGEKSIYYIEKYNSETLDLEYQKDLKICSDDKAALVHPLFVPPVCFESNGLLVVFYNSYNESDKVVNINVKTVNQLGEVNSKWNTIISSKDIDVQMDGMYWNLIGYYKPVISYYISEDKKTVIIEIDSPKLKKIYSYAIDDLFKGKTDHKEYDIKTLTETEKIIVNHCFLVNGNLCFFYTKKVSVKVSDFGFAILDPNTNSFKLKSAGFNVNEIFSVDYISDQASNKIFAMGYLRYPINASKAVDIENSKVKMFNVQLNFTTSEFENKNEIPFLPNIAKYISVPKVNYGFIDKTHTPDQYLENMGIVKSSEYYYSISHLLFGRGPTSGVINPRGVSGAAQGGGGVTTVSRDILINKFDLSGKLINQYLLPFHTSFNTFAGTRSGTLYTFENRQRNFNYILKNNDLHFFYLDAKKNPLTLLELYNPQDIDHCNVNNGALVHFSIKNDKVEKEILVEKNHKCYFFSNQNLMIKDAVIIDVESGKKDSYIGKVTIK